MNRLNLFFLCLFGVFLLSEHAGENLWADDSVMQRIRSIIDECSKNMKKIKRGELTLSFHTENEEHPSFSVQKHLGIVFDGEKMVVTHETERTVVYAFNCYKPGTLAYFRTSLPNMVGSPPPANLDIQDFHLDRLELFPFPMDIEIGKDLSDLNKVVDSKEFTIPTPVTLCRIGQTVNSISMLSKVKAETPEVYFDSFKKKYKKNIEDALQDDNGGFFNYQLTEDAVDGDLCYKVSREVISSLITDRVAIKEGRELSGKEKIEFVRQYRSKGRQTYWFDKLHGSIIRKMLVQSEPASPSASPEVVAGYTSEMTLTNKLSQETKSGIWYPSSWISTSSIGGKPNTREEGTLEYKSINQPIPAERFSLENIAELKPNCPVEWHLDSPPPGKGKVIWDGKKIVGLGFDNDSYEAAKRKHRIAFIVLANVLIISCLIFVQFLRVWTRGSSS